MGQQGQCWACGKIFTYFVNGQSCPSSVAPTLYPRCEDCALAGWEHYGYVLAVLEGMRSWEQVMNSRLERRAWSIKATLEMRGKTKDELFRDVCIRDRKKLREAHPGKTDLLMGAVAGDIIGSVYEHHNTRSTRFPLFRPESKFTDDSVLTLAVAQAILTGREYGEVIKEFALRYPRAGYGGSFKAWMNAEGSKPYGSWGNGSAMRVASVGFGCHSEEQVLQEAERSAAVTHNHPEGIKGAQAVALSIFLARQGMSKPELKKEIMGRFGYDLNPTLNGIRPHYHFDVSCQGTVPVAITAFLESESVEDAIRKAISVGGDSDTIACIAGGIAQAHYKEVPERIRREVESRLPLEFLTILDDFDWVFGVNHGIRRKRWSHQKTGSEVAC